MNKKYLTELHLHTKESSSCSQILAKKMIEEYKKQSYSTIVITDHCSKSKNGKIRRYKMERKSRLCI